MGADKMILRSPPLEMGQELWGLVGRSPGAASESCHPMPNGQIYSLNTSGVQPPGEAQSLQSGAFERPLFPDA